MIKQPLTIAFVKELLNLNRYCMRFKFLNSFFLLALTINIWSANAQTNAVLTAEKSGASIEADAEEKERRLNQAAMTELSRNSKQVIATESSHEIHIDQPELVVDAIRQVVEAAKQKKILKK